MPKVPYNLDAGWYAAERYMLLETALHNNNNLTFSQATHTMRGGRLVSSPKHGHVSGYEFATRRFHHRFEGLA